MPNRPTDDSPISDSKPQDNEAKVNEAKVNNTQMDSLNSSSQKTQTPFERKQFGGSERPLKNTEDEAPISRSDLKKGAQELSKNTVAHINWSVLIISSLVIVAFSIWAIVMPDGARNTMEIVVDWIASNLGWYYVITMVLVIGFVLWVALSKAGSIRLVPMIPDHSISLEHGWRCCLQRASVLTCCFSQ